MCIQKTPERRKFKNYYAEIVINPGKGEKEIQYRLGPVMLRFFWLTLYAKSLGNDWVNKETLENELHYDDSDKPGWFSKRISYIKKKWLKDNKLTQYFEFHDCQVRTTLSTDQFSLSNLNYDKAKNETHPK